MAGIKHINKIKTEPYKKWLEIMSWCNKNHSKFKDLTVCDEWKDFNIFYDWWELNKIDGLVFHYNSFHISPENCCFMDKKESNNIKIKNYNLRKYGVEHFQSLDSFRKNKPKQTQETINKRIQSFNNRTKEQKEESLKKKKQTSLINFGVENPQSLDIVKNKTKKTCLEKYGEIAPAKSNSIKEKICNTNLQKYGKKYYTQTEKFLKSSQDTCLKKYGENHYNKSIEGRKRLRKSSIKRGIAIIIDGKTLSEIAKEKGVAASSIHQKYKKIGNQVVSYKKNESFLETVIKKHLESNNINFLHNKKIGNYFPDFSFNNIIIECDGLYWHSDIFHNSSYHKNKRDFYIKSGYRPFFFREDEIINKLEIVKSIISNSIHINKKIYARQCIFKPISKSIAKDFFENNHLMGNGNGLCFGLYFEDLLVSVMSVKKINNGLDVSRFCCLNNYSVIGGFSKLLKNIEKKFNPDFVQTFIDLRYGSGEYLKDFGFIKESERVSFKWVKDNKTVHRMNFPGNTGYDHGFNKIWDCGQAKWVKYLS